MFERFTTNARAAVVQAQTVAKRLDATTIGTGHLLLGIIGTAQGPLKDTLTESGLTEQYVETRLRERATFSEDDAAALRSIGVDLDAIRARLQEAFGKDVLDEPQPARKSWLQRFIDHVPIMPPVKKALELSLREAIAHKDGFIGSEHLLLGLLRTQDKASYPIITDAVDPVELRRRVTELLDRAA